MSASIFNWFLRRLSGFEGVAGPGPPFCSVAHDNWTASSLVNNEWTASSLEKDNWTASSLVNDEVCK